MFATMTRTATAAPTVLVIEDDTDLLSVLKKLLVSAGYSVASEQDGDAGLSTALGSSPDLVLLDVGLPDRSGYEVARELRARGFQSPVLMLTARSSVSDKVSGLDAGADDYLPKPFEFQELLARVKALLRRASLGPSSLTLRAGDLTVDTIARRVEQRGEPVHLTQKEYVLLTYLVKNAGRTVTRRMIAEHVWRQALDPDTNIIDVYISYLRRKLDDGSGQSPIETVKGRGYRVRA